MKKLLCMLAVVLVCLMLVPPAMAASDTFVPSISYKDGPEIEEAGLDGKDAGGCLVVSSIKDARNKTTDIYQEDRDLLLEVYEQLDDGSMELPLENGKYVVRELVDVSFRKTDCVEADHGHKEWLAQDNTTVTIRFDLGVNKDTDVTVLVYIDGEWIPAEKVVNNGDGTLTCEFEDICPVAFCIDPTVEKEPVRTGDAMAGKLGIWVAALAASLVVLVVLILNRRKLIK